MIQGQRPVSFVDHRPSVSAILYRNSHRKEKQPKENSLSGVNITFYTLKSFWINRNEKILLIMKELISRIAVEILKMSWLIVLLFVVYYKYIVVDFICFLVF